MQTIGAALLDLKQRSRLSLSAIARSAGYSGPSSVQAFFNSDYDPPALDVTVAQKLAAALSGHGEPPIQEDEVYTLLRVNRGSEHGPSSSLHRKNYLEADVPVYRTGFPPTNLFPVENVVGSNLTSIDMRAPYRYYPRASGLAWNEGAFCFHIVGPYLSPRFNDGEPVFISDSRTAAVGDDVVLFLRKARENDRPHDLDLLLIGKLVDADYLTMTVSQYNSPRSSSPVKRTAIKRFVRIAPWAEVCGLPYA